MALNTPIKDFDSVSTADVALVFGALVRNGEISPLHEERLLSAKRLIDSQTVERLVLSNSARAAGLMERYLLESGIHKSRIEIDGSAIKTSDTCKRERAVGDSRSVILISQSFHLPRLAYQCSRLGVTGQYLAAEKLNINPREPVALRTKLRIRGWRYIREAALAWSVLIGVYEYV